MTQEALRMALEALYPIAHNTTDDPRGQAYKAITAIKEALAQTQEPVAWEQFYPDIGKPQIEQPKVRTGDCLLVGVCASEGHKIQAKQEPWRESASDYERGFIDGMQKQMQSSVDKAVSRMAQPEQEPVATDWSAVHKTLELVWFGEISADEGLDEIQDLIYTSPPQRTWAGLTDEERSELVTLHHGWNEYGQAIEAKLKELNT